MERAIILCKLKKSLLESSKSVGMLRQKSLYSLKNFVFNKPVGPIKCEKMFFFYYTATVYRQTTDELVFKSVISTQIYLYF